MEGGFPFRARLCGKLPKAFACTKGRGHARNVPGMRKRGTEDAGPPRNAFLAPSVMAYSSVHLTNRSRPASPEIPVFVEFPSAPAGLVPISEAARKIGVERSWAFRQHQKGLLTSATGARPILVSPQELARLRKRDQRRPRRVKAGGGATRR